MKTNKLIKLTLTNLYNYFNPINNNMPHFNFSYMYKSNRTSKSELLKIKVNIKVDF